MGGCVCVCLTVCVCAYLWLSVCVCIYDSLAVWLSVYFCVHVCPYLCAHDLPVDDNRRGDSILCFTNVSEDGEGTESHEVIPKSVVVVNRNMTAWRRRTASLWPWKKKTGQKNCCHSKYSNYYSTAKDSKFLFLLSCNYRVEGMNNFKLWQQTLKSKTTS